MLKDLLKERNKRPGSSLVELVAEHLLNLADPESPSTVTTSEPRRLHSLEYLDDAEEPFEEES